MDRPLQILFSPVTAIVGMVAIATASVVLLARAAVITVRERPEAHPQQAWAPCNRNADRAAPSSFTPLSDRRAATLVTPEPETRPDNDKPFTVDGIEHAAPNTYVATQAQIAAFRTSQTSNGQSAVQLNPYFRYVDGRDGIHDPSTDDLIQWASHKWGIPEDWLRAEYVQESYWNMYQLGDETAVTAKAYRRYPPQARVTGQLDAYQSLGITQVRWDPQGDVGVGAEPLRWESEAFNIDYQASMVRFYYDNPERTRSAWGDSAYVPCQKWESIGGWFNSYPWQNQGQALYIRDVKKLLASRAWDSSDFLSWSLPSLPAGISLR